MRLAFPKATEQEMDQGQPAKQSAPLFEARDVGVSYRSRGRADVDVLSSFSLSVAQGEFVCVVGPSGCGKTTLLRCLSGLMSVTSGEMRMNGRPVVGPPAGAALVFQNYGDVLLPWRTAEKNIALAVEQRSLSRQQRRARVLDALETVGLSGHREHYPWQMSGGMQQRVQIARALAYDPEIMFMDEPFGALDAQTRMNLEDELLRVWAATGKSILLVTHDIDESVYLADRVVVLGGSPTRVLRDITIDLPRPREQMLTKSAPAFSEYRSQIYELIRHGRAQDTP